MAKPYVPAEYAFHIRSNDYKPDPLYFAKNRIFVPNDAPLNIQGDKGALFVNNRPFWLIKGMGAVKNPPRRTKVQMHKNLKKMYEGNKKALAPPQGRRDNFCDPKTASYELVKKKLGAEEWRFAERQMTANTFYATLFLEAEKARLDKEPKPAHLEEKKTSEKMLKFKFFDEKGAIVISENPPVNVPSFLYTYDRYPLISIFIFSLPFFQKRTPWSRVPAPGNSPIHSLRGSNRWPKTCQKRHLVDQLVVF